MPMTSAPAGVQLTTSLQTIYTNPFGSSVRQTVLVRFVNIDGVNDADISSCQFLDASASNAANPILPVNFTVKAKDGVSFKKVLEPSDSIRASASAAGDIHATVDVIFTEPV